MLLDERPHSCDAPFIYIVIMVFVLPKITGASSPWAVYIVSYSMVFDMIKAKAKTRVRGIIDTPGFGSSSSITWQLQYDNYPSLHRQANLAAAIHHKNCCASSGRA